MKVKCKLNDNVIVGYFHQYSDKPLHKVGCNFNEKTDHATAVEVEVPSIDKIHINVSKVLDGMFIENI